MNESMTQTDARSEYIAGWRKLADAFETDPELRLPKGAGPEFWDSLPVAVSSREQMAAWVALLTDAREEESGGNYYVQGRIDGLHVKVYGSVEQLGGAEVVMRPTREVEPFLPQPVSA